MNNTTAEILNQIKEYKKNLRVSLRRAYADEKDKRYNAGEIFYEGFWVPNDKLLSIQKALIKKRIIIVIEMHLLFSLIIVSDALIWKFFSVLLLPGR